MLYLAYQSVGIIYGDIGEINHDNPLYLQQIVTMILLRRNIPIVRILFHIYLHAHTRRYLGIPVNYHLDSDAGGHCQVLCLCLICER